MSHQIPAAQGMASQSSEAASTAIPKGSIVLATSDNQKVPVDRLLLAANSSVFRDMLDLSPDNGEECPVAEKHADVLLFVNALEGEPAKDEATWLALYRMMDKYDAPIIHLSLL
ncbi:hypothetical protein C6P46_003098 [Rhodotorula mucilaginosa]|uniref:BTB domain-containing protein n=1 Tax=Rhodotorula mucilaginosa TaxID=5537 RepID=A0A9P7B7P4_RHOMI|nr:hypothetical protein C6P46_003098 [Rhodotorula mucilaginosa]